ncbi:aminoglycoside phosphotransferase family protein [Radiobacillus kanasensis]|uniref:phosphotransferase n=1 Tax=Radiobacillus kanasensis TaxID=2844358 RepID=UPI001E2C75F4|nr:phosphotransferase [Radiobacillus kanasensis]UFT97938.1 aminoglycoside phosphotransferase family protein [Radiobacillus kanasensis]
MDHLQKVLENYQIASTNMIPITSRLYKVQSHNLSFALKRSKLEASSLSMWQQVYSIANKEQLSSILPVFLTRDQDISCVYDTDYYYLTPWCEAREVDEPDHEMESFMKEIGTIHNRTKRSHPFDKSRAMKQIQKEKKRLNQMERKLTAYVEKFEQRRYMAPFELRVCTQYRDILHAFRALHEWYDEYLDEVEDIKAFPIALCHGDLRSSHKVFQQEMTYFLNWEHAYFGPPVQDLASYLFHEAKYHDNRVDYIIQSMPIYESYNPLEDYEKSLLAIHSLNPSYYLNVINRYLKQEYNRPQPFQIRYLEYHYRRILSGLKLQSKLKELREQTMEESTSSD